jgi:uncharacterized protein with GYD domain
MKKMAKRRAAARSAKKSDAEAGDDVTYFFLVNKTDQGRRQREAAARKEQDKVTETVKAEGGECELYSTFGPHDYVSRVTGVSVSGAVRIAKAIEAGGNVTATMLPAMHMLK